MNKFKTQTLLDSNSPYEIVYLFLVLVSLEPTSD